MVYLTIILSLILLTIAGLVWLRKAQYDAIHRNFLDLVDRYGGRVMRGGFAIRPKYAGTYKENNVSISFSSEKKNKNETRRYYLSVFLQTSNEVNFSILSMEWLGDKDQVDLSGRSIIKIFNNSYVIEVTDKDLIKKLDVAAIEKTVEKIHPFAYTLISKKGILFERISYNLLGDTDIKPISELLEGLHGLTTIAFLKNDSDLT